LKGRLQHQRRRRLPDRIMVMVVSESEKALIADSRKLPSVKA
jgi:hypothetical protein